MIMKAFWMSEIFICCLVLYRLWLGSQRTKNWGAKLLESNKVTMQKREHKSVCVQLPLFNERGQVHGLLEAVCNQDWPKISVQVLDDSDCLECKLETQSAVSLHRQSHPHIPIELISRTDRNGFKAGALNFGMAHNRDAEYFAIFDCDFRPPNDFVSKMMPEFEKEKNVAAVQAPWTYINPNQNILTKIQALLLGAHFYVEHWGRQSKKWVLNFNGTAGIWSRAALQTLGGWSDRSVTEDLLLSYRAELAGMRIRYTEVTHCPSELPARFSSFLVQQKRWARGHGQVLRMMAFEVLKNNRWTNLKKMDALMHLHAYNISAILSILLLLLPFWVRDRSQFMRDTHFFEPMRMADSALWILTIFLFLRLYSSSQISGLGPQKLRSRLWHSLALALHAPYLSIMVMGSYLKGLTRSPNHPKVVTFERTPKSQNRSQLNFYGSVKAFCPVFILSLYLLVMAMFCFYKMLWLAGGFFFIQSATGVGLTLHDIFYEPFDAKQKRQGNAHEVDLPEMPTTQELAT